MNIEIPVQLVSESNTSEHWSKKHKRHSRQKSITKLYLLMNRVEKNVPVIVTIIRYGKRRMDEDNLIAACKYIKDAVSEYFFPHMLAGRADDLECFQWRWKQEVGEDPKIVITLEYEKETQHATIWYENTESLRRDNRQPRRRKGSSRGENTDDSCKPRGTGRNRRKV